MYEDFGRVNLHGRQFSQTGECSQVPNPYHGERIYYARRASTAMRVRDFLTRLSFGMRPHFSRPTPNSLEILVTPVSRNCHGTYTKAPCQVLKTRQLKPKIDMNPKLRLGIVS